ncbi:MAG TPA: hypothetical protein VL092_08070, partial [Chitinophagaceae bacterium]|nr:hypothetical protein [Chitinophagaceae bacterium]
HLDGSMQWKGEKLGILEMRRHYANYLRGLSHVKEFRSRLVNTMEPEELYNILREVEEHYSNEVIG